MKKFDVFWLQAKKLTLSDAQRERVHARLQDYQTDSVRKEADSCLDDTMQSSRSPFWESAQTPLLTPDRKAVIGARLRAYTEGKEQHSMSLSSWFSWKWRMLTASVATVFSMGSMGLCYAAEAAVPGDALYPVKINVNETVLGALALSPEARAAWQVRISERRLSEEQRLLVRGTLTEEESEELHEAVAERIQVASDRIQAFAAEYPEEAAALQIRLSLAAAAHADTLERIRERWGIDEPLLPLLRNANSSADSSISITPIFPRLHERIRLRREGL